MLRDCVITWVSLLILLDIYSSSHTTLTQRRFKVESTFLQHCALGWYSGAATSPNLPLYAEVEVYNSTNF